MREPREETADEREEREIVIPIVEEGAPADTGKAAATEEIEGMRDKWLRAAADLDNLRKRTARDVESARARERENLLRSFLEVLDSLERALDSHGAEGNPWLEGVEAIGQQMLAVLRQWGAEPFKCIGETFDPTRHSAVATVNLAGKRPGEIVDVTQVGYAMSNGTILRPAQVIVAQ